jgi:FkbM family methyltransferase
MHRLYGRFIQPGDLVFDIGAHVGDRVAVFRRLGARVLAVEPQPALVKTLRLLYCLDPALTIEPMAAGARTGTIKLMLNIDNPTVATASSRFVQAASGIPAGAGKMDKHHRGTNHDARCADRPSWHAGLRQD